MCVRWDDFATNAHISSVKGLANICTTIRLGGLSLLGHTARLDGVVPGLKDFALTTKYVSFPTQDGVAPGVVYDTHGWKEDIAAPLDSLMCLATNRQAWRSLRYCPPLLSYTKNLKNLYALLVIIKLYISSRNVSPPERFCSFMISRRMNKSIIMITVPEILETSSALDRGLCGKRFRYFRVIKGSQQVHYGYSGLCQ